MLLFMIVVLISDVLACDDFVVTEVYVFVVMICVDEVKAIKCRLYTLV